MPSIRSPKMPARPTVARRSARVMLAVAVAAAATAGGARSCGMGRAADEKAEGGKKCGGKCQRRVRKREDETGA